MDSFKKLTRQRWTEYICYGMKHSVVEDRTTQRYKWTSTTNSNSNAIVYDFESHNFGSSTGNSVNPL